MAITFRCTAMEYDTTQQSRILLKILSRVGLWRDERTPGRLPPLMVSLLIHIPLTFTFTILMWLDAANSSELGDAMDVLYIAFTETALVVKVVSILIHMRLAQSLLHEWQTHANFRLQSIKEQLMWKRTFDVFGRVAFIYITISISVVSCAFTAVLFLQTYQLPFRYWTPFDWKQPQYYWYAYFYEILAMPLTCISNCTLDMLQCFMMQYLAMCFGLIAARLQNLGSKSSDSNADIRRTLIQLMQFDQQVRRMCRQCERIVSYPIFTQILLSALVLCFSLYRLQHVSFLEDPGNFASLLQYAIVMILQIFLPCYYANELTVYSSRPLDSIFNSNWTQMSAANRKMILCYMLYLNKTVILRAGNFFDIGLPIFSKTMNNAYSFFALLLNMDI